MSKIIITELDEFARAALKTALLQAGIEDCNVISPQKADGFAGAIAAIHVGADEGVQKPLRFGALLDRINRLLQTDTAIAIGPYRLAAHSSNLVNAQSGAMIRLTEKEKHILVFLHQAQGAIVDRRALLNEVWGYADNVETHTLETHIYRLRQKIESDPAAPKILLTHEQGYALAL